MGFLEALIIGLIALVLFAPGKLPGLAATFGNVVRGFKQGLHGDTDKEQRTTRRIDKD